MSKKQSKNKKSPPRPKMNDQIPNSLVRRSSFKDPRQPVQRAREHPLYGCWIMAGWQESGITPVVVARQQVSGRIMFGVYMVDLYCLGVKDAFVRFDYAPNKFNRELPALCAGAPERCTEELAHEVIYGGIAYAEKIGFQPHPDFTGQMADLMLDPPDAHPRVDNVVFGKDGKPMYVSGPYDDQHKISFVMSTLQRTCGEGHYDYLIGIPDGLEE